MISNSGNFDGPTLGIHVALTEQARALYDGTVANYRLSVLTAFQEVEDNLAALRILSRELEQQNAAVASAQRTLTLANDRYKSGIDSYLNVITTQTALLNNQRTAVTLQMDEMTASVQLIKALGGGWSASQLPTPKELTSKMPLPTPQSPVAKPTPTPEPTQNPTPRPTPGS